MPHPHLDWRPDGKTARSIANARVCLALLRIYRSIPIAPEDVDFPGVARCLWPVVRLFPDLLRAALGAPATQYRALRTRRPVLEEDIKTELAHLTRIRRMPREPLLEVVFELVGEAISHQPPAFTRLLVAVDGKLQGIAACRTPSDAREDLIADLLALSVDERAYLRLCAAVAASSLGSTFFNVAKAPLVLVQATRAAIGAKQDHEVRAMLNRNSRLFRSGVLDCDPFGPRSDMEDAVRLTQEATQLLQTPARTVEGLAKVALRETARCSNEVLAWPHLVQHATILRQLLVNTQAARSKGINILLHGAPGTGKTQFALRLIEEAGLRGYCVSDLDRFGAAASRSERLSSMMLTQLFAPTGRSVILLDEAEDVFQNDYNNPFARALGKREDEGKSWMNRLLEDNAHPVIWISNRIDHIDPAYLRRFSFCLEFPTTPRQVRREIAHSHLAVIGCSDALIDHVAAQPRISPALVASAARCTAIASPSAAPSAVDDTVRLVLGGLVRASGGKMQMQIPERATRFDLDYLNVKGQVSADVFMESVCRLGRARAVLSGAPGTGKTQLAGEIAARMGRELVYRTASDINSMWYGESERNVAKMFEECDASAEVLFLDEADSLLASREGSSHRADVAVTAEFLRHIENFKGVFVCATNFHSRLDPAMLRRFEFRLELLPLSRAQRLRLFGEVALQELDAALEGRLARLDQLTPGDFATVVRRARAMRVTHDAESLLRELEAEHEAKPGGPRRTVGFL